jgi:hypothetical protein
MPLSQSCDSASSVGFLLESIALIRPNFTLLARTSANNNIFIAFSTPLVAYIRFYSAIPIVVIIPALRLSSLPLLIDIPITEGQLLDFPSMFGRLIIEPLRLQHPYAVRLTNEEGK